MLSGRNRMRRSTDFDTTVKHGARAVQPDLVVYARRGNVSEAEAPKIGFIIARSVGSAVQRHRVARQLRHAARAVVDGLEQSQRLVIRALPSSRDAGSTRLEQQLRSGLKRIQLTGSDR
ncbi:MAG: ribonuclease P protein component [Mycobacterium sp.]